MSHKTFVWICLLPLAVVTAAFFLLPMARLVVTGAEGPQGLAGYLAIVVEPRYRATLINTVVLATATTTVTLAIATVAGMSSFSASSMPQPRVAAEAMTHEETGSSPPRVMVYVRAEKNAKPQPVTIDSLTQRALPGT